jgi:hypothetical protein
METKTNPTYQQRIDAMSDLVHPEVKVAFSELCEAVSKLNKVCQSREACEEDPIRTEHGDMHVFFIAQIDGNEDDKCVRMAYTNGETEKLKLEALRFALRGTIE